MMTKTKTKENTQKDQARGNQNENSKAQNSGAEGHGTHSAGKRYNKNNKDKKNSKNEKGRLRTGLALWQKATVILSLLSFYTTKQGFQNTVFVGSHPAWPLFASFAIQTILLVGILFGFSIIRRLPILKRVIVLFIWGCTAFVSIMFSYISIVNSMYHLDFAVNGNEILEKFIRNTVRTLENTNQKEMEELRPALVGNLMEHGRDVIDEAVKARAGNYVSVTEDYPQTVIDNSLVDVEPQYFSNGYEYIWDESGPIKATREYVINRYPETYASQREGKEEYWAESVANTINKLNEISYKEYLECCEKENVLIASYNACRKIEGKNEMASLDRLRSLESEGDVLLADVDEGINNLTNYEIKGKMRTDGTGPYDNKTANANVDVARDKWNTLSSSVKDLKITIGNFISNSYGDDNLSVDEILALIGNSSADIEDLEKARDQMLTAQGSILQSIMEENSSAGKKTDEETVTRELQEINELMSQLDTYVNKANYNNSISNYKESYLQYMYNIVEENGNTGKSGGVAAQNVKSVTPDEWTQERKVHMASLTGLIFDFPLYESDTDDLKNTNNGGNARTETDSDEQIMESLKNSSYEKQKLFLDTSESEKACNMLFGNSEDFKYKGKAVLSGFFALFLDLGAAAVGYMIDSIQGFITKNGSPEEGCRYRTE